jgi:hypothetical protein
MFVRAVSNNQIKELPVEMGDLKEKVSLMHTFTHNYVYVHIYAYMYVYIYIRVDTLM